MITEKTVRYIASLARLHIEDAQASSYAKELESIIQYIDKLNSVDVNGIKPTSHVLDIENVFRDDIVTPGLTQQEALAIGSFNLNGGFKVPKVIE